MTALPNPQLTPEVIMAQIKRRYVKVPTARNMLTIEPIAAPTATWIEEKDIDGKVNFISGKGGFKKIYQNFQKKSISTVPYGVQFDVTRDEFNFQQYVTVDDKITSAINEFNAFENDYIWDSILNNPSIPTLSVAKAWDDPAQGKPLKDLQQAKIAIKAATKKRFSPTTLIVPSQVYSELLDYDFITNALYNNRDVVATGAIPALNGMTVIENDDVDPEGKGQALVCIPGQLGKLMETYPFTVVSSGWEAAQNPMVHSTYYMFAQTACALTHPETAVLLTDLL